METDASPRLRRACQPGPCRSTFLSSVAARVDTRCPAATRSEPARPAHTFVKITKIALSGGIVTGTASVGLIDTVEIGVTPAGVTSSTA